MFGIQDGQGLDFIFLVQSFLLIIEIALVVGSGILVLLVLGHQVVHVALSLCELHLVHALAGVPVKEGLPPEHGGELLGDALEEFLDGGAVADERTRHLESTWWDVADGGFDVVGDPFHEVAAVLVLDVEHLLVDLLHGHTTTEDDGDGKVASVSRVTSSHHVLGVEHLSRQFWNSHGAVLLAASAGKWRKAGNEEVETRERDHVDSELAQIRIQLSWKPEASGHTTHGGRNQVVQVAISRGGKLKCPEADVVQGFVVDAECFVCVLDQLMHRECGIVGFDDSV